MHSRWWQVATVVVVSVGFVVLLFVGAEFGRMRLVSAEEDVRRAHAQLARVVDLYQLLMNAESGVYEYLLTGDPGHLEPLYRTEGKIAPLADELARTYRGRDERVGAAIRQLGTISRDRVKQMQEMVDAYDADGPLAALMIANSASRHETTATFRELAGITRDFERALLERSLETLERELLISGRLNLATLTLGLLLAALAGFALARSVRQRAEAAADLQRQHHQLKAQFDVQTDELTNLARHLQHVQEEERARLSRGLHDELGGILLAARMDVTWMERQAACTDAEVRQRLERLREVLDQGIELKRRVVEELRPTLLDTMGLEAALRWQTEETCGRANLRCNTRFPDEAPCLSWAGAIALFRVVQEALANVVKHAEASEVEVAFEVTSDEVIVTVQDDGVGAEESRVAAPRAHGVAGMRHRIYVLGGQLDVTRGPGGGTTVRAAVPLASVIAAEGSDADSSGTYRSIPWASAMGSP
jgi:signal transduction histidine kinase